MRDFYLRNVKKNFVLLGVNVDQNKKALDDYNEAATFAYPKINAFQPSGGSPCGTSIISVN